MTYWALNAVFLGAIAVVAVVGLLADRHPHWRAVGLTMLALLATTAVFDNVMIGVGLVAYDPARISGVRIGLAPIEDFAYAVAAVVLLPVLWHLLPARRRGAAERIESKDDASPGAGSTVAAARTDPDLLAFDTEERRARGDEEARG